MRTPEYVAWVGMIQRCENRKLPDFPRWGGRGIRVCRRWRKSFAAFLADVGGRPSTLHSLDRYPRRDGNYEPGNVRWATKREQARNTRSNHRVTAHGETLCLVEWSERTGVPDYVIRARLRLGWKPEDAVSRPLRPELFRFRGELLTAARIIERTGVSRSSFWRRVRKLGDAELAADEAA